MRSSLSASFGLALACLVFVLPARAAVLCANSVPSLIAALDNAEANSEDDEIRIVEGTYLLGAALTLSIHEAFAVALSGRWNAGCAVQDGGSSTLDGQGMSRILYAFSDAASDLSITDLVFANGHNGAATAGGGLSIETSGRDVLIERNLFFGNEDLASAGAARIAVSTSDSFVTFRNNVVIGNTAPEASGVAVNASIGQAYVTGNTIVANVATLPGALCGGLCIAGGSDFTVSNNILWDNDAGDIHIGNTGDALLLHNDIGTMTGQPPSAGSTGNLSVEPGFAPGFLNLRLAPDSPLVDAGTPAAPGGLGLFDYARASRIQGTTVDIGAFETDVIFRDGFENVSL